MSGEHNMNRPLLNPVLKNKLRYFHYLPSKGFKVSRTSNFLESFVNRFIEFESPDCYIVVFFDREEVVVRFYPVKADRKYVTDLGFMLYLLSNGKLFMKEIVDSAVLSEKQQLVRLSSLLEEYLDRMLPYFGRGFEQHKDKMNLVTKEYDRILLRRYGIQNIRARFGGQ
jgi:hypothetical protein